MEPTLTIEIPLDMVVALSLILERLTFDDCLRRTDGYEGHPETGNTNQAYEFINAIGALRDALSAA